MPTKSETKHALPVPTPHQRMCAELSGRTVEDVQMDYVRAAAPEEPIRSTQRRGEEGVFGYRTHRLAGFSYLDSLAEWRARAAIAKAEGR